MSDPALSPEPRTSTTFRSPPRRGRIRLPRPLAAMAPRLPETAPLAAMALRLVGVAPVAAMALCLSGAAPLAAQTGLVAGTVVDEETGAPVPSASVQVLGAGEADVAGVFTDDDGRFRLSLSPGSYALVVSSLGRGTRRVDDVRVAAGETETLRVELPTTALQLNPLVVTASRREEKALAAPAAISIVPREVIRQRIAVTPVEHVEGLEGVDVARTGLLQSNVVTRGFNNVFSGSLLVMTDNRYAHVPSLRVNAHNMIPVTNLDVERVEVVLGPAAALYGPNSATGVMHLITSSPIDDPGTTVTLGTGRRAANSLEKSGGGLFQGAFRHAFAASDVFGFKVSGQWFSGDDWPYVDPAEVSAARELPDDALIGDRLDRAERWGGEIRFDWRPWDDGEVILNGGLNRLVSSVELTGQGAGQARDWNYGYLQTRLRKGRFFAQAYMNSSDAGDTYLLRTGRPIVDESRMWVGQLQHGFDLGSTQSFTYGLDLQFTEPRTAGTITGENEEDDEIAEIGGYLQSETSLGEDLDFVAALRIDDHSRLADLNVSPRTGLVYRPLPDQNFRLTFNRAFSTPTTNNLFLDIVAAYVPVPPESPLFRYEVRTHGVPAGGYAFDARCEGGVLDLCMRSPFAQGSRLPASAPPFWNALIQAGAQLGLVSDEAAGRLLDPGSHPDDPELGTALRRLSLSASQTGEGEVFPLDPGGPARISPLEPTITNTVELGYKGLIADRVMLSANVYRSDIRDFVGPLRVETPSVFLDPATTTAYVQKRLGPAVASGDVSPEEVQAILEGVLSIPIGTVAPDARNDSDLILTYRNFGQVDLWGADLGAEIIAGPRLTFRGTVSWVSEECIEFGAGTDCLGPSDISLNAPALKGSVGARWDDKLMGLTLEARGRFTDDFVMNSGVYLGEVDGYGLLDASATYRLTSPPGASVSLAVNNVFNHLHREFVGAPELGRLALLQLRYDF